MTNNYWYAILMDNDDNDWGTGSYDLAEAKSEVARYKAMGYPNAYIAVIDEGGDPICVEVIR